MLRTIPGTSVGRDSARELVLAYFFDFPTTPVGLNEVASAAGIAKSTASVVVNQLVADGFLHKEIFGRAWRLTANRSHELFTLRKIARTLQLISESGLVEFLNGKYSSRKVMILFGSYRKGDDREPSDLDIAIELYDGTTHIEEACVLKQFGGRQNVPVNVLCFTRATVDPNVFVNIANGIVLDGLFEVTR